MTSLEIAQKIYTPEFGISFDAFARRVVVATSSLCHDDRLSKHKGHGGQVMWGLKLWDIHGEIGWQGLLRSDDHTVNDELISERRRLVLAEIKRIGKDSSDADHETTRAILTDGPNQ